MGCYRCGAGSYCQAADPDECGGPHPRFVWLGDTKMTWAEYDRHATLYFLQDFVRGLLRGFEVTRAVVEILDDEELGWVFHFRATTDSGMAIDHKEPCHSGCAFGVIPKLSKAIPKRDETLPREDPRCQLYFGDGAVRQLCDEQPEALSSCQRFRKAMDILRPRAQW